MPRRKGSHARGYEASRESRSTGDQEGKCPHMACLKDLGAPRNILIHNLQDDLRGKAHVIAAAAPVRAARLACFMRCCLRLLPTSMASGAFLGGPLSHLLNQGQDKGESSQANGSHADSKGLLRNAGCSVRQLLPKDHLQNLHGAAPTSAKAWVHCHSSPATVRTHRG